MMCSAVAMEQQQYIQCSSSVTGSTSGAPQEGNGIGDLPPEISQMDFQTIKAASDTLKV